LRGHVYALTRFLPFTIDCNGKRGNRALKLLESLFPVQGIVIGAEGLKLDSAYKNERILFYFFYNLLRHYHRSPLSRYMTRRLSTDDVFLDIGANLGLYSYIAKQCGSRVCLFEPEPHLAAFLRRNGHLFDQVFEVALSDRQAECDFYVGDDTHLTSSSLVISNTGWEASGYARIIKVNSQRLDNILCEAAIIDHIRLIKIDVEGAEASVIAGMTGVLARQHSDIWCEVRGDQSGRNPGSYREVERILQPLGYDAYVFDGVTTQRFSARHVRQVFDLLFVPNPC
jgi:FkbM family methyltransferase